MSEISAWQDATSDMDQAAPRPEGGEATHEPASFIGPAPEPADDNGVPVPEATVRVAVSVEVEGGEAAPGEPLLLLADHSGEPVEAEADTPEQDELEHGIASVIASLYADSRDESAAEAPADEAEEDDDAVEVDDAITYQLLGELDRLWHRAA